MFVCLFLFGTGLFLSQPPQIQATNLTIKFLGTAAASSYMWIGGSPTRQLASALINTDLLIDFSCWTDSQNGNAGTCGLARLRQYNVNIDQITTILITHPHQDHFDPDQIVKLAQARTSSTKLTLYSGSETVRIMNAYLQTHNLTNLMNVVHLVRGQKLTIGNYEVQATKATHDADAYETYVYAITYGNKKFLYATDSYLFGTEANAILSTLKLDLVIRDATFANDCSNTGSSQHLNFCLNQTERNDWIQKGIITSSTPYYLTHLYKCFGRCTSLAGITIALDGDQIDLAVAPSSTPTPSYTPTPTRILTPTLTSTPSPTLIPTWSVSVTGDTNDDYVVNLSDYLVWYQEFSTKKTTNLKADFNKNGQTDLSDYLVWYHAFAVSK